MRSGRFAVAGAWAAGCETSFPLAHGDLCSDPAASLFLGVKITQGIEEVAEKSVLEML